jgi:hypothetical protein
LFLFSGDDGPKGVRGDDAPDGLPGAIGRYIYEYFSTRYHFL